MSERVNVLRKKRGESRGGSSFSKPRPVSRRTASRDMPVGNILHLQRTLGNREVRRLIKSGKIQAKLKIGKPNDKYEQEADRIAAKVMSMSEPKQSLVNGHSSLAQRKSDCPECTEKEGIQTKPLADQITPLVQRQTEEDEEPAQTKIQRQETEEDEEPAQTKIQWQADKEEEEPVQTKLQRQPEDEEEPVRPKPASNQTPAVTPNVESNINSLKGGGQPLPESTRSYFEPRFGADFSQVRVHTGSQAAETAKSINAKAFTKGKDVVFGSGQYSPGTSEGKRLLGHELTHVVQQNPVAEDQRIQRDIRSPVIEETVTQISDIEASIHSRPLGPNEEKLARSIFGKSIDYTRVRLIPTKLLIWRTVGNTIRVPKNFTIKNAYMEHTYIHEMTHVWQYQHGGTGYISKSLSDQMVAAVKTGSRGGAYTAKVVPGKSFFEYRVEQQASIVQDYFIMVKLHAGSKTSPARKAQLAKKIALYKTLIAQMSAALPRKEIQILNFRASEGMGTSGKMNLLLEETVPKERRYSPIKPLLQWEF